jgi:hypothetical protein
MHHTSFIWISLTFITFGLLISCLIVACRRRHRPDNVGGWLPDFVILDRGDSIHLVPVERARHRIDNTGRCRCRPVISINQRRLGAYVRYVDHHLAGDEPTIAPSRDMPGRRSTPHP